MDASPDKYLSVTNQRECETTLRNTNVGSPSNSNTNQCETTPTLRNTNVVSPSNWNSNTSACELCKSAFGYVYSRPHHCRFCGLCVCYSCSPHSAPDQHGVPQRMCNQCNQRTDIVKQEVPTNELVTTSQLERAIKWILAYAISGITGVSDSAKIRLSRYRQLYPNPQEAIQHTLQKNHSFSAQLQRAAVYSIPFVGIPAALCYPLWRQLREVILIAGVYGHDVESEHVQEQILYCIMLQDTRLPVRAAPILATVATREIEHQLVPMITNVAARHAATQIGKTITSTAAEAGANGLQIVGKSIGGHYGGIGAQYVSETTGLGAVLSKVSETIAGKALATNTAKSALTQAAMYSPTVQQVATTGAAVGAGMLTFAAGIPLNLLVAWLTDNSAKIFELAQATFEK